MLRALGEQLKLLAFDPKNHYASAIRQLTGPREAVRFGQPLRKMILALPRMIAQLNRWGDRSRRSSRGVRMRKFALAYLYEPIDFLPSHHPGLFRYLDDAYLIARIYQLGLAEIAVANRRAKGDDQELVKSVPGWIDLSRTLLPKETARIDELLEEVARGRRDQVKEVYKRAARRKRVAAKVDHVDIGGEG